MLGAFSAQAETYALVVGIDDYTSLSKGDSADLLDRKWRDLKGAVNDANAMSSVLRSRFGVKESNIHTLLAPVGEVGNPDIYPTRARSLEELNDHLLAKAKDGNELIFYFSGHGSQVHSAHSDEQDQFDETIVPADAITGVPDIRDKELRQLYNKMLDRGARLVVIADSCHSGSISRGLPVEIVGSRNLPPREQAFVELGDVGPIPSENGAIVLSATSPAQLAREISAPDGTKRGGFTYALIKSLLTSNAGESTDVIFKRTHVYMKGMGLKQQPLLEARDDKKAEPLIPAGLLKSGDSQSGVAAWVISSEEKEVTLLGGLDIGLYPGTIITVEKAAGSRIKLEVTSNDGLTQSIAKFIDEKDSGKLESGDLGFVTEWAFYESAELRVWLGEPQPPPPLEQQEAMRAAVSKSADSWVGDPARDSVDTIIRQSGSGWEVYSQGTAEQLTGTDKLLDTLQGSEHKRVFVQFSPDIDLANTLQTRLEAIPAVRVVESPETAHYVLSCRMEKSGEKTQQACAWILPNQSADDAWSALPLSTDWVPVTPDAVEKSARTLEELAFKLAKLKSWLSLSAPPAKYAFPYQLEMWLADKDQAVDLEQGLVLDPNQKYRVMLVSHSENLKKAMIFSGPKYVYVGGIDGYGRGVLLYPGSKKMETCETLPCKTASQPSYQSAYEVSGYGPVRNRDADIIYMITSSEKIHPSVFKFKGVHRSRELSATRGSPVSQLEVVLDSHSNMRSRSGRTTPLNWSIQQIIVPVAQE